MTNKRGKLGEDGSRPDGSRKRRLEGIPRLKEAKFMEEVEGIEVVQSPLSEELQEICEKMVLMEKWWVSRKPASAMDVQNIKLLHEKPYRVSWKADGVQGQEVGKTSHDIRMQCIEKEIEFARSQAAQQGLFDKSREPFSIRAKQFFPVERTEWVLEKWSPKLSHENDGLIFNPAEEPYAPGQCPEVMKWKPHTLNSVDFVLNIRTVKQEGCIPECLGALMVGGYDKPFASIKVTKELKNLDKKVVECTWDAKLNQWKFLKVREDKSYPNGYKTAMSVCKSIKQPVTKKWLLEVIEKYRYHEKKHRDPNVPSTSHTAV
ncbi:hypothetical protein OS493_037346 [Desmophyllum pertusum]|uniref:mRNA guanylyltransferase n=1 Tax=Desmophyllum pertusum TaxID=174260 RepID=A0A9X0CHP7_9CNID|nr:hypothetical protein OS493_037346 [Desmophyllum pertusum]